MGEKSKERIALFLFSNVTEWEQCCEVKCIFWSLTTETTLKYQENYGGSLYRSPWLRSNCSFIHDNCPQGSEGLNVGPISGHMIKYAAMFLPLLKMLLQCYWPYLFRHQFSRNVIIVRNTAQSELRPACLCGYCWKSHSAALSVLKATFLLLELTIFGVWGGGHLCITLSLSFCLLSPFP